MTESHHEFWKRGVKLLALSCDRLHAHIAWIEVRIYETLLLVILSYFIQIC